MDRIGNSIWGMACAACIAVTAPAQAAWKVDATFGTAGIVSTATASGTQEALVASAVDAQGRIVAVGTFEYAGKRDLLVSRTTADGLPDLGFGFDGRITIDAGSDADSAVAVVIQSDGRIVVGGTRGGAALLLRLDAQGALDPSFGSGGLLIPSFLNGGSPRIHDLALDAQGRVVALGSLVGLGGQPVVNAFVLRAQQDGSLDRAFDNDGVRIVQDLPMMPAALVLDASGRIVMVGHWNDEYRLAALTTSGTPDLGFGSGGTARAVVGAGAVATDLIAHGGTLYVSGLNSKPLLRLDPAGAVDRGFGTNGMAQAIQTIDVWTLATLTDGTLGLGGSCREAAGESSMFGTLTTAGITVASCGPARSLVASVRGLAPHAGSVVAIGHEYAAAGARAVTLRYITEPIAAVATTASVDKRCNKKKFRKRHPALCSK